MADRDRRMKKKNKWMKWKRGGKGRDEVAEKKAEMFFSSRSEMRRCCMLVRCLAARTDQPDAAAINCVHCQNSEEVVFSFFFCEVQEAIGSVVQLQQAASHDSASHDCP